MIRLAPLLACGAAALLAAAEAGAHVTMLPPFAEANVAARVVLETPNERTGHATTSLDIEAPAGITVVSATAPAGWRVTHTERRATWSGGRITGTELVDFPVELKAVVRAGTYRIRAVQRYEDGRDVRWDTAFTVLPSRGNAAPAEHLRRAVVAGVVGIAIVVLSMLILRRLRSRSLPDR